MNYDDVSIKNGDVMQFYIIVNDFRGYYKLLYITSALHQN